MADDYSRALSRVVAGELAEFTGFDAIQESSAEILSELLLKYISELCSSSHMYGELASRTDINILDVTLALDDMGTSIHDLRTYLTFLNDTAKVPTQQGNVYT
jgi:transcription initiation factor TFIID subunit 8